MIRAQNNRTEKPRQNQLAPLDVARALCHQIVADHSEMRPQLKDVPTVLP